MASRIKKPTVPPTRGHVPSPLPLVGRSRDLAMVRQALTHHQVVMLQGAIGVGKSVLAKAAAAELGVRTAVVTCLPGDSRYTLIARVERALQCGLGQAAEIMASTATLLIVDQAHEVGSESTNGVLLDLGISVTGLGRVLITTREPLALVLAVPVVTQLVGSLDQASTVELWEQLDLRHGPVAQPFVEQELWHQTRGNPSALRAQFGKLLASRSSAVHQQVWELVASLRVPVTLASVLAWCPDHAAASAAVDDLVARQVLTVDGDMITMRSLAAASDTLALPVSRLLEFWRGDNHGVALVDAAREALGVALAHGSVDDQIAALAAVERCRYHRGALGELFALVSKIDHPDGKALAISLALQGRRIHDLRLLLHRHKQLVMSPAVVAAGLIAAGNLDEAKRLAPPESPVACEIAWKQLLVVLPQAAAMAPMIVGFAAWHQQGPAAALPLFAAMRSPTAAHDTQTTLLAGVAVAHCVLQLGRLAEAAALQAELSQQAASFESVAVHDALQGLVASLAVAKADFRHANVTLRKLAHEQRLRGDELAALEAEIGVAELEITRGHIVAATELAAAVRQAGERLALPVLVARASLVLANVDLLELRADAALTKLDGLAAASLGARRAAQAIVARAKALGYLGQLAAAHELRETVAAEVTFDEVERMMALAEIALATGDLGSARELLGNVAATAERHGRRALMLLALATLARVEMARGDRSQARACATRAAREASVCELDHARCLALLALSALARSEDDVATGVAYARDAAELATLAGLPIERFVAYAALDAVAGPEAVADPATPSAATLTPAAFEVCTRMLAELGLSSQRPFALIDASGAQADVVDASPEVLQLAKRALAVDGVRETIWRHGQELADLRRRSLLKKLLFLFASSPGSVFSKEAIVSAVWNVEYHPLRHDAALFTNIMRIRRLLGEGGAEIIRVTDDGYRFVPPADFVFVFAR